MYARLVTDSDVKACSEHETRDVNCLNDALADWQQSVLDLERLLVHQVDELTTDVVDATLDAQLKPSRINSETSTRDADS